MYIKQKQVGLTYLILLRGGQKYWLKEFFCTTVPGIRDDQKGRSSNDVNDGLMSDGWTVDERSRAQRAGRGYGFPFRDDQ